MDRANSERGDVPAAGPFPGALRAAILARGLSLARIQSRLADRGTPVSVATLSHWQSGRSQPERVVSFQALAHLEQILGTPPGALASLLEPPRPRGRRAADEPLTFEEVFRNDRLISEALRRFDHTSERDLANLSFHDRVDVGSDGRVHTVWSRRVMRATLDGPDRIVVLYGCDTAAAPTVWAVRGCTIGKTFADPQLPGVVIIELLVGRRLRQGESLIMEYEVEFHAPFPCDTQWEKRFDRPSREYVLEVAFAPSRLPARCVRYSAVEGKADELTERVVALDGYARASSVALDVGPGRVGMRWEWPDR